MRTHKKVTYTLPKDIIVSIEVELLMKQSVGVEKSKSSIIKDCLLQSFGLFESELVEYGKKEFENIPKKFPNTIPKTYTLPIEMVERLDYYSKELGIKKSHLILISVEVGLNGR